MFPAVSKAAAFVAGGSPWLRGLLLRKGNCGQQASCQVVWVCYKGTRISGGIFLEISKAEQVENPCSRNPHYFFPPPNVCSIISQRQRSPLCGETFLMGNFSARFGKASPLTSGLSLPLPREPHGQSLLPLAPIQSGTYAGHCSDSEAGGSLPGCPGD